MLDLTKDPVLFGADPEAGLVAVEQSGDASMRLFSRRGEQIHTREEPFTPFILMTDGDLLRGFKGSPQLEPLAGDNYYRVVAFFAGWNECKRAANYLKRLTGQSPSSPQVPYVFLTDPVHQYLLITGKTLFKGFGFDAVHRLALDLETATAPGYLFSNPERPEDRIISIGLMDNRGYQEVIFGADLDEKEMLLQLNERLRRLDPDIIEGHNIFNFDLEYLVARARRHRVKLPWGRDGSEPRMRRSRFAVAERTIDYTRMEVYGRHVIDTLFLVQYYDVAARELEGYGLKAVARHFNLSGPERIHIEPQQIQWYYHHDPEALKRYNLDDVRETLALAERLGQPFFLQACIFPYSYQNILVRGNATKINSLLLREYLRQRYSIPAPREARSFAGGYTAVFRTGVVGPVAACDVASLYPSILLAYNLRPAGDRLDIFLPLLRDLRSFRLQAKHQAHATTDPESAAFFDAMQQTFKVVINSFYGYLGTHLHHFSDPEVAAEVTRIGRKIIKQMIEWLRQRGAEPVEIDTDGIYFLPPPGDEAPDKVTVLVEELSASLPEGIEVELAGYYRSMFSYKKKNYALLDPDGRVIIKGSALRSRGMEPYLREFLEQMIKLLLEGRGEDIDQLCNQYVQRLRRHQIRIEHLAKTETLAVAPETYLEKVRAGGRNPAATYELALASDRAYRAGDQISFYVTGSSKKVRVYDNCKLVTDYDPANPDENVAYYEAKLLELRKKFDEFIP